MMKFLVTLILVAVLSDDVQAAPTLFDFGLNANGTTYCALGPCDFDGLSLASMSLPGLDASAFDASLGLGTLTYLFDPGATGSYAVSLFLDHEIDEPVNGFDNERGAAVGAAAAGQRWEIDEPGASLGDIFENMLDNRFDDTNQVPAGAEDDVSMGLGWEFVLAAGEQALMTFSVSELVTPSGFYLSHLDPDSAVTLFFSSTLDIRAAAPTPVPEPAPLWLVLIGLILVGARHRYAPDSVNGAQ